MLLKSIGERVDERCSPVIRRPNDDLVFEVTELLEIIVGDALDWEAGPESVSCDVALKEKIRDTKHQIIRLRTKQKR
jgi:hypothetical protein